MQASAAGLQRMHAAGIVSPLRVSSSAWSTTRRLAANRGVRTGLHTVQAAEQRASGSEPSSVDIKDTSQPKQKGQSPAEQSADHSADANISSRDSKSSASVKKAKEGKEDGEDSASRQKQAEQMMDDAEGAGGHGYS